MYPQDGDVRRKLYVHGRKYKPCLLSLWKGDKKEEKMGPNFEKHLAFLQTLEVDYERRKKKKKEALIKGTAYLVLILVFLILVTWSIYS